MLHPPPRPDAAAAVAAAVGGCGTQGSSPALLYRSLNLQQSERNAHRRSSSKVCSSGFFLFILLGFFFLYINNSADQVFAGDVPEANNKCLQNFCQETGCYLNKRLLDLAAEVHQNATTDFFFSLNHWRCNTLFSLGSKMCVINWRCIELLLKQSADLIYILLGGVKRSDKDQTLLILTQTEEKIEPHMLSGIRTPSNPGHQAVI